MGKTIVLMFLLMAPLLQTKSISDEHSSYFIKKSNIFEKLGNKIEFYILSWVYHVFKAHYNQIVFLLICCSVERSILKEWEQIYLILIGMHICIYKMIKRPQTWIHICSIQKVTLVVNRKWYLMNTWRGGRGGLQCFVLATSTLGWPEEVFSCCIVEWCKEPFGLKLCRGTLQPAGLKREEVWMVSRWTKEEDADVGEGRRERECFELQLWVASRRAYGQAVLGQGHAGLASSVKESFGSLLWSVSSDSPKKRSIR